MIAVLARLMIIVFKTTCLFSIYQKYFIFCNLLTFNDYLIFAIILLTISRYWLLKGHCNHLLKDLFAICCYIDFVIQRKNCIFDFNF